VVFLLKPTADYANGTDRRISALSANIRGSVLLLGLCDAEEGARLTG
jgi:hypothetical protein